MFDYGRLRPVAQVRSRAQESVAQETGPRIRDVRFWPYPDHRKGETFELGCVAGVIDVAAVYLGTQPTTTP